MNNLENFRNIYKSTRATPNLSFYGWSNLSARMDKRFFFGINPFIKFATVGFLSLLFIFGGFFSYRSVKAALPGETLYPVKTFSEDLISAFSGNNQIKIDNRAEEIVKLVERKNNENDVLEEIADDYSEEVKENRRKLEKNEEDKERFETGIEKNHRRFKEIISKNPEIKDSISPALEIAVEKDRED